MIRQWFSAFVCLFLLSACASHYRRSADREVAGIITDRSKVVRNADTNFTLSTTNEITLTNLEVFDQSEEAFGTEKDLEKGARILTLAQALDIAVHRSNQYLTQKEKLYLSALDLTYQRYLYTPIFTGNLSVTDQHQRQNVANNVDKIIDNHSVKFTGRLSAQSLLRTGGKLSADFTTDFLRFFGGPTAWTSASSSALSADLTQPLLRGAGYMVAMEQLTQAERSFLYALRNFTKNRQDFSLQIAQQYYNVLQARDQIRNSWRSLQNFKDSATLAQEKFKADQGSQSAVDQARQNELGAESSWLGAIQSYRSQLDNFKILIGLRTDDHVILDDRELEILKIIPTEINVEDAVNVAMLNRLDLDNQRDQLADAARKVKISANGLLPQLDFNAAVNVARSSDTFLPTPDWNRYGWNTGLNFVLPIQQVAERNNYRSSLIALDQSKRNFQLAIDNLRVQIVNDWRDLDVKRRTYEINVQGVQISTRRVETQKLLQELGQTTMLEIISAQNDFINSKNAVTSSLISYVMARVTFFSHMGVLWIMDSGQWDENKTAADIKNETKNR